MYLSHDIRTTTELSPTTKLFLHSLASYADQDGLCWPSQDTLALAMSMSVATVKRCIRECLELRLIEVRRRWRKSNVYKLLCVRQPKLFTMGSPDELREAPPFEEKRSERHEKRVCKDPRDVKILLEDLEELVGARTAQRNKGWLITLARKIPDDWLYESISWVRDAMTTGTVTSPSGLLTWRLRKLGAPI